MDSDSLRLWKDKHYHFLACLLHDGHGADDDVHAAADDVEDAGDARADAAGNVDDGTQRARIIPWVNGPGAMRRLLWFLR